jgi:hypothetical protein
VSSPDFNIAQPSKIILAASDRSGKNVSLDLFT